MLFLISAISFFAIHLAPNSLFNAGELNPNMTQEALSRLKSIYGLDKTLIEQYINWLKNITTLNFGVSFVTGNDAIEDILKRVPITLFLNGITLIFVFIISIYLGIKSALNLNKKSDYIIKQFSLISFSIPSFYLALLFIIIFSVNLNIFPISGVHSLGIDHSNNFLYYSDMLWHLILPLSVMIITSLGSMIVYIRSLTLEILKSDYYFFAKSRNLNNKIILINYILPNLFPPIITLLGLSLPGLIGGSVILESIFGIDGMGQLFFLSTLSRDYPVIMGILMFSSLLTLIGNIVADLILLKLNPYSNK